MNYKELSSSSDFKLIASIKHEDMKSTIVSEMEKQAIWARIANMYQVTGLLAFILAVFNSFIPFFTKKETLNLWWLFLGLIFTFTFLIILHEAIHAIAYRIIGARNISFGMNIRKFMFYVQADRHVLNYKQFQFVALAPVVTVAILTIIGMIIFYKQPEFYLFIPILAFHSVFCGGDFGLLSFFANRPEKEILTFDIKEESTTYFYEKIK